MNYFGMLSIFILLLTSCGKGKIKINLFDRLRSLDSSTSKLSYVRFIDPTPGVDDKFGYLNIIELGPDRYLVSDYKDDTVDTDAGAFHIYDSNGTIIKSVYGIYASEMFGRYYNFKKLSNGRFAYIDKNFNASGGTLSSAGQVIIYDKDGNEFFRIEGDDTNDQFGNLFELSNGNFVISASWDSTVDHSQLGRVILIDGTTGNVIETLRPGNSGGSDEDNDRFASGDDWGNNPIVELSNGNFLITSSNDNDGATSSVGSLTMVNSNDGSVIAFITPQVAGGTNDFLDKFASGGGISPSAGSGGIIELSNGNVVVCSSDETTDGNMDNGSVTIIDGNNGSIIAYIDPSDAGGTDSSFNHFCEGGILKLNDGNFAVVSESDSSNVGSVTIFNGNDGSLIKRLTPGNTGGVDTPGVQFGGSYVFQNNVSNALFIISANDTQGGQDQVGSVTVVHGTTWEPLARLTPSDFGGTDDNSDKFGYYGYRLLQSGNVTISSRLDDISGITDVGSVAVISPTGDPLSYLHPGNTGGTNEANDNFTHGGAHNSVFELSNGNFIICTATDDEGAIANVGSITLVNGNNGSPIARYTPSIIGGQNESNSTFGFGSYAGIEVLDDGNFLVSHTKDNFSGISNTGSLTLINGDTGAVLFYKTAGDLGATTDENDSITSISSFFKLDNNDFVIPMNSDDLSDGTANVGGVAILDPINYSVKHFLDPSYFGEPNDTNSYFGSQLMKLSNGNIIINNYMENYNSLSSSGTVILLKFNN